MVAVSSPTVSMRSYPASTSAVLPKEQASKIHLDSFNDLVLKYQDTVYWHAYWILGEEEAAQDAAQEAFLRAYQNMHLFNGGPFLPWILRITTNYCYDQLRSKKRRKNTSLEVLDENGEEVESSPWLRDPALSVEETLVRTEEWDWIMKCIRRLPLESRTAVVLVDLHNLNYAQAAATMGICLGTFKSRLARAREQLQTYLRMGSVSALR